MTLSSIPQAIKVIISKDTEGISLLMYIFFIIGIGSWCAYGIMVGSIQMWLSNAITLLFSFITISIKIYNIAKGKEPLSNYKKKEKVS
jgi:MtN3 and saliva related transmembrane protein